FERDRAWRLAWRAHEQRRADIGPNALMRGRDGGARIKRVRNIGSRLEEIVERARHRLGAMIERDQRAVAVGAKTQGLPRRRAVAHRTEHLVAPEHELDRSAHGAGGNGTENLRSGHQTFGAEAAAEKRTADVNLIGRYAEQSGKTPLRHRHTLTRRIDRERIALPRGNNRMRLH